MPPHLVTTVTSVVTSTLSTASAVRIAAQSANSTHWSGEPLLLVMGTSVEDRLLFRLEPKEDKGGKLCTSLSEIFPLPHSSANTMFEMEWHGRQVALKASNGRYVCMKKNGQLAAISDFVGEHSLPSVSWGSSPSRVCASEVPWAPP